MSRILLVFGVLVISLSKSFHAPRNLEIVSTFDRRGHPSVIDDEAKTIARY